MTDSDSYYLGKFSNIYLFSLSFFFFLHINQLFYTPYSTNVCITYESVSVACFFLPWFLDIWSCLLPYLG